MGEGRRPETAGVADEHPHPEITLREISAWSLAVLAATAAGFVLYAAREVMLPVVAAFVVGIMLGPAARRTRSAARSATARCASPGGQRDADNRLRNPAHLPARVGARQWLAGNGCLTQGEVARVRWLGQSMAASHDDDWRTPKRQWCRDSYTRNFLGPLDDLDLAAADNGLPFLSRRVAFGHLGMAGLASRPGYDLRKPRFPSDGAQDP